jgi:hypothetical protein
MAQKEKDRKRYEELLAQGIKPSVALQIIESEHESSASEEVEKPEPRENRSRRPGKYTLIGELKHLSREVGREVIEFPKRTLKQAAEDIEIGRAYRESYRKHKSEAASSRGAGAEERHHREKLETESDQLKRKKTLKDIEISEQKAYRIERAKIAARERAKLSKHPRDSVTRPTRPQIVRMKPVSKPIVQVSLRQQYSSLDPYGIYQLRSNQNSDTSWLTGRIVSGNVDAMHSLLGFNKPHPDQSQPKAQQNEKHQKKSKSKQKQKRYNVFTGQYEVI